ncbi:epithelial-stromal interaction protein 1 [Lampris incognitus]|uniref:epithelial-stromal interaction protein 1 n=1 Tax=Lampris incognitus TaxID=2546036 RepID=UPI0024B52587|nr:epithelial-stromal interaction protein 1 [Lampris incognitus]
MPSSRFTAQDLVDDPGFGIVAPVSSVCHPSHLAPKKMENKDTSDNLNYKENPTNRRAGTSNMSGFANLPENANGNEPDSGQANPKTQDKSVGYTMIAPNNHRWSNLKSKAQKEEEDLQRWREAHRATPVHLTPERLGGNVSMDRAREKQLIDLRQSKLQKRLKKEEMDRRRRQEEEEELQKMKAVQREKAERLEERRRQQEQRRSEQFRQDQLRVTESFLQRLELTGQAPTASTHMSAWSEALGEKQREREEVSERELQLDHRRVNSAFLDKLEARRAEVEREEVGEGTHPSSTYEDFRCQSDQSSETPDPFIRMKPDTDERFPGWMHEAEDGLGSSAQLFGGDPEPDYEWALMKLESRFPECSRVFLEDILIQCNGDYQQAYTLLSDTCL